MKSPRIAGLLLLVLALPAAAETFNGRVVGISDGDTLTLLVEEKPVKIRLAEIDAPESSQAFGEKAKQALADVAFYEMARVEVETTDRYGRKVGRVFVRNVEKTAEIDVNAEMVKRGLAWVYVKYAKDPALPPLQAAAQEARLGLWADEKPVPPWVFRHEADDPPKAAAPVEPVPPALPAVPDAAETVPETPKAAPEAAPPHPVEEKPKFTCGGKRNCRDMSSCAEATHYLTQCGMKKLDRDNNGIPCEDTACSRLQRYREDLQNNFR